MTTYQFCDCNLYCELKTIDCFNQENAVGLHCKKICKGRGWLAKKALLKIYRSSDFRNEESSLGYQMSFSKCNGKVCCHWKVHNCYFKVSEK